MGQKLILEAWIEAGEVIMKLAFVSDTVYPYFKGGKENRLHEITTRLADRGHNVHIYTMQWWKGAKTKKENNLTLHAISPLYPLYTSSGRRSISEAILFSLHILPALWKEDFDIIDVDSMPHFPVFPSWLISKLKRKPLFVTWHEHWGTHWFNYLGLAGVFGLFMESVAKTFSTKAIVVSNLTSKRLKGIKKYLIPNGISLNKFTKVKANKNKWDISYVGRLIAHKNLDLLINVANEKGYKTIIMGKGPEEKKLKKLAKKNIRFTGFVKYDQEVFSNIKSSKVFVTLSEREGFGISILEAMACATPVVTSKHKDNAGKFLITKAKTGYAVELEKKKIILAIESCIKRNKSMSKEAKKFAQNFDWDKIVDKLERVYNG